MFAAVKYPEIRLFFHDIQMILKSLGYPKAVVNLINIKQLRKGSYRILKKISLEFKIKSSKQANCKLWQYPRGEARRRKRNKYHCSVSETIIEVSHLGTDSYRMRRGILEKVTSGNLSKNLERRNEIVTFFEKNRKVCRYMQLCVCSLLKDCPGVWEFC